MQINFNLILKHYCTMIGMRFFPVIIMACVLLQVTVVYSGGVSNPKYGEATLLISYEQEVACVNDTFQITVYWSPNDGTFGNCRVSVGFYPSDVLTIISSQTVFHCSSGSATIDVQADAPGITTLVVTYWGESLGNYYVITTETKEFTVLEVSIRAENGLDEPETFLCADSQMMYSAVVTPYIPGTYQWMALGGLVTLSNENTELVTVNAGSMPSSAVGDEPLMLDFTPQSGSSLCTTSICLTLLHVEHEKDPVVLCACTNVCVQDVYLTNSFSPDGVSWSLEPDNLTDGATISGSGDMATVNPGSVLTNYLLKAVSVDNSNCYDTATLSVSAVHISPHQTNTCGWCTNNCDVVFFLTNSFVPGAVLWEIDPVGLPDGAMLSPSGEMLTVEPGSIGTTYVIRASSADNTNCFDTAQLDVFNVDIASTQIVGCVTCSNNCDVEITLTNSYSPAGVDWKIEPTNIVNGASLTPNGAYAVFHPGTVATTYLVHAISRDDTNCADSVKCVAENIELDQHIVYGDANSSTNYTLSLALTNSLYASSLQWTLTPDSVASGAVVIASNDIAQVKPGRIPMNYTIRVSSESNTNCFDEATLSVFAMSFYRDEDMTKPLNDWPEQTNNAGAVISLRSPKYIFGQSDNMYICAQSPTGYTNNLLVRVQSASSPAGFMIPLSESEPGIYKNSGQGDLLRLSWIDDHDDDARYIRVVEEELLTFTLHSDQGRIGCVTNIMVDRGEFATGIARSFDSRIARPSSDRTPIWSVTADEVVADITDPWEGNLDWMETWSFRATDAGNNLGFTALIIHGGGTDPFHLETDFFYTHSHGYPSGNLAGTMPNPLAPPPDEVVETIFDASVQLAGVWCNDIDWVMIKACSALKHNDAGRPRYQSALTSLPRPAHGVLGFEDPSISDYASYADDFFDGIGNRLTIVQSWIDANTGIAPWGDQPYAVVCHAECQNDRFRKPDEDGEGLSPDVATQNFVYFWRDTNGVSGTTSLGVNAMSQAVSQQVVWNGQAVTKQVPIMMSMPSIPSVSVEPHLFVINADAEQFVMNKSWSSGRVVMARDMDLDAPALTYDDAERIAFQFAQKYHFPVDIDIGEYAPICRETASGDKRVIAYTLSFTHSIDQVPIVMDAITMIIQHDGVCFISAFWHDVSVDSLLAPMGVSLFDVDAFQVCVNWLNSSYDGYTELPDVSYIRPAYCIHESLGVKMVWDLKFENGPHVFYDPTDQSVIDIVHLYELQKR